MKRLSSFGLNAVLTLTIITFSLVGIVLVDAADAAAGQGTGHRCELVRGAIRQLQPSARALRGPDSAVPGNLLHVIDGEGEDAADAARARRALGAE